MGTADGVLEGSDSDNFEVESDICPSRRSKMVMNLRNSTAFEQVERPAHEIVKKDMINFSQLSSPAFHRAKLIVIPVFYFITSYSTPSG